MLKYFELSFYTVPIQIVLNLLFINGCLLNYKKIRPLRILLFYSLIGILQSFIGVYVSVYDINNPTQFRIVTYSVNIFMIIEFIIFYYFIIKSIRSAKIKILFRCVAAIFVTTIILYWTFTKSFNDIPSKLTVAESYLVIIACLYYYYELFQFPPKIKLFKDPVFWAITGMLILFILLAPLFSQENTLYINTAYQAKIYTINFIGYILIFFFFINALRCQLQISNQ